MTPIAFYATIEGQKNFETYVDVSIASKGTKKQMRDPGTENQLNRTSLKHIKCNKLRLKDIIIEDNKKETRLIQIEFRKKEKF